MPVYKLLVVVESEPGKKTRNTVAITANDEVTARRSVIHRALEGGRRVVQMKCVGAQGNGPSRGKNKGRQ